MDARKLFLVLALSGLTCGCATAGAPDAAAADDPFEAVNRVFFDFNQSIDVHAALPAATAYTDNVPGSVRENVRNVLINLSGPVDVANNILEAKFTDAGQAAARFVVNSTIGVAGIFDVATDWGLPDHHRDFGETLGTYGVDQGPYMVLPLAGPTAVRDFAGSYVDGFFSPLRFVKYNGSNYVGLIKSSLGSVANRSANIGTYRDIERVSLDYYDAMRTYYRQRRQRQIEDKPVQTALLPDF